MGIWCRWKYNSNILDLQLPVADLVVFRPLEELPTFRH